MNRSFVIILFCGVLACLHATTPSYTHHAAPATFYAQHSHGTHARASVENTDTIPPTIICPPDETILLEPGRCDTVLFYDVTANDDSLVIQPDMWGGIASGEVFPIGTTLNIFVAEDSSGNTADCSFSVTVMADTTALSCRDTVVVYLDMNCSVFPNPTDLLSGDYGCPLNLLAEADRTAPFGDGPWGSAFFEVADRNKLYVYRVTDLLSSSSCTGIIRILDTLAPALDCPTVSVPCILPAGHLLPDFLRDTLGILEGVPVLNENCAGNTSLNFVDVRTDYPCDSIGVAGIITRFWTALDASNNVATCVQTIVRHRSVDDVQFPLDGTFDCAPQPLPAVTGWPYIEVGGRPYSLNEAQSCGIETEFTDAEQINCGAARYITRLWTVQDGCLPDSLANPMVGEQAVEVLDVLEPVLHCPEDTVVFIIGTDCMGPVDLPDIVVEDACSYLLGVTAFWSINGVDDSLSAVLTDFIGNDTLARDTLAMFGEASGFPVGNTTILLVATDACGNTSECEIGLIVWDSIPPVAVCDTFLTAYLDDQGLAALPSGLFDEGSMDACNNTVFFKARRQEAGACDTLGNVWDDYVLSCCADLGDTVTVLLRVYDVPVPPGPVSDSLALGQYSECSVPVLLFDLNNPKCSAPADTVVLCADFDPTLAAYGFAQISCTVDSVGISANYQQYDTICNQGMITRTFRVFDANGVSGQCTQQIDVENEQRYFVRFPDDLVIMACDTSGNYGAPMFFGTGCENMIASFVEATLFNVPDACFRIERIWTIYNTCAYDSSQALIAIPNPNPMVLRYTPTTSPALLFRSRVLWVIGRPRSST
ncbi:MAG: HYR domain-containing protein [Lewinellaceae bacterium]|nr:HYR domain-containing protein [Lewinellaceae bacterium]